MDRKTQKFTLFGMFVFLCIFLLAVDNSASSDRQVQAAELELPVVGNAEKLQDLLEEWWNESSGGISPYAVYNDAGMIAETQEMTSVDAASEAEPSGGMDANYSETNVQVQGVDEADLVKTDGKYLYQITDDSLRIIQAVPADQMQLVSEISFPTEEFTPQELYIDGNRLVLIGQYWKNFTDEPISWNRLYGRNSGMRILLYDLTDLNSPRLTRQEDLPGRAISTRKVGDYLYFALTQDIDYEALREGEGYLPTYQEQTFGTVGETMRQQDIPLSEVRYFPDCIQPQYLMLGVLSIQNFSQPAMVQAYLGDGSALYATSENIYVALTEWQFSNERSGENVSQEIFWEAPEPQTHVYRFALDQMKIICEGKGMVPGEIVNQFSMDEYDGYFRIATTTGDMWAEGEDISKNNVYILDGQLQQVGALTGIAPGEQIYSVRFMGDRAYMVTFRNVDPFFVLDVSQPENPSVLGKLKIPGYSDYLHPYDENHIIGFGKETIEVKGSGEEPTAYYLGMKVALFDVTDVANPIEMSKITIGDRGTESELLQDHKALLFDRSKNLLAFPVTVMSLNGQPVLNEESSYVYPNYGEFDFQGAYVYRLDTENGFNLKGRITHLSDEFYQQAGSGWYDSDLNIRRILYIGDQLYTISDRMIQACQIETLEKTGELQFDAE